jgi:hypothetical protein
MAVGMGSSGQFTTPQVFAFEPLNTQRLMSVGI